MIWHILLYVVGALLAWFLIPIVVGRMLLLTRYGQEPPSITTQYRAYDLMGEWFDTRAEMIVFYAVAPLLYVERWWRHRRYLKLARRIDRKLGLGAYGKDRSHQA